MERIPHLKARLPEVPAPEPASGSVAAVLVLLGVHPTGEEVVLLTKRTMTVETHKGQVSFPGGLWERADESLLHTALRETEEEIGVPAAAIEVLGRLETAHTRQEMVIYPWVGVMSLPFAFRPSPAEVDRVIELPLETLVKEGLKQVTVPIGSAKVESVGIYADGELVWGATARMLKDLYGLLLGI